MGERRTRGRAGARWGAFIQNLTPVWLGKPSPKRRIFSFLHIVVEEYVIWGMLNRLAFAHDGARDSTLSPFLR